MLVVVITICQESSRIMFLEPFKILMGSTFKWMKFRWRAGFFRYNWDGTGASKDCPQAIGRSRGGRYTKIHIISR